MNFYKNQEIQITARFIGVADNGKIQVKIKGIDDITLNIDKEYINAGGNNAMNPIPSSTTSVTPSPPSKESRKKKSMKKRQSIKKQQLDKEANDTWGGSDDEEEDGLNGVDTKEEEPKEIEVEVEEEVEEEEMEKPKKVAKKPKTPANQSETDEKFHKKHKFKSIVVEDDGMVIKTTEDKSIMAAFGSYVCSEPNKIYHWKMKVVEGKDVNFGVIFSDQCKKNKKQMWWLTDEGYSYWGADGQIYHSDKYKKYGDTYGEGDEIDVWLNTKKYSISWAKNGEKYGKGFKVNKEQSYRFGVGFAGHPHVVEMLEFDIKDKN